jgi:coenzyme F420-0:L-glutamate ligase/coenzyme F420-1:gamma-L-glutamate ligase
MIELFPLEGLPIIKPGDDLSALLLNSLRSLHPQANDILVVTSKIVSKAEGRFVNLRDVTPSEQANELAQVSRKDPRLVELILRESQIVSRVAPGVLITQHHLGFTSANAAIDHSNVSDDVDMVLLMPLDPDASARQLQACLSEALGTHIAIVIVDSHGRPHRVGTVGVAVGVAGMPGVEDWRGRPDLFGYQLQHTEIGLADMVASAATLLLGQAAEGIPAVLVRGVTFSRNEGSAAEIIRSASVNLYA